MIINHLTYAGRQYERPACDIVELSVDTAILVDSIDSSTISPYLDDENGITL